MCQRRFERKDLVNYLWENKGVLKKKKNTGGEEVRPLFNSTGEGVRASQVDILGGLTPHWEWESRGAGKESEQKLKMPAKGWGTT